MKLMKTENIWGKGGATMATRPGQKPKERR